MSTTALVALGSNLGRRDANLQGAIRALQAAPGTRVVCVSPFVETAPVGGPADQADFLNAVVELETELEARALLELLQRIEADHGRDRRREVPQGPRTLDLDLLLYGREQIDEPGLIVPHPRMEERTFVLEPLAHIAPDLVLPACGRTVSARLRDLAR